MQTKCTSCGATHKSSEGLNCNYCGNAIIDGNNAINERIEKLNSNGNFFKLAETAFEGDDFDEAIKYYNKCLEIDSDFFEAWYKKGLSILMTSTIGEFKSKQAIVAFEHSINNSPDQEKFKKRIKKEIVQLLCIYYKASFNHFVEFKDLPNAGLEFSYKLSKSNETLDFVINRLGFEINDLKLIHNTLSSMNITKLMGEYLLKKDGTEKMNDLSNARIQIDELSNRLVEQWQKLEPETAPKIKKKSGCFIATAAMGDYNHPVVVDLRIFRDNWLLKRKWGIKFTNWYYTYSPKVANVIEKSFILRRLTFVLIVKPLQLITKGLR